jgi:hypothetical protein
MVIDDDPAGDEESHTGRKKARKPRLQFGTSKFSIG